jgi:hypothetical protein
VSSAAIPLGDNKLLGIDDTAILYDITCDCGVVLNEVRIHCLQASDLCGNGCLVAAQASEDLLTSNSIRLVDGIVRAVSGAVVAIESESLTTSEVTLRDRSRNQILVDDSGRAEKSANGSCASTSANLWKTSACAHLAVQVGLTIVTRFGSPPNCAIFFLTHSRAVIWSPIPKLPLILVPGMARKPSVDKR